MKASDPTSVASRTISAEASAAACQAAVQRARDLGIRINVAVVDQGGNLAAFLRMPGAFIPSIDISIDKAYTAAGFGFPTSGWKAALANDELLRLGINGRPRVVVFGGGVPIREGGELIGAIGVSGGSAEQDEVCAEAGLKAIGLI